MDLLTGSTGFLGRHLAARLTADGTRLRALVRPGTDLRRIPREVSEVVWGGLDDPEAVERALHGIDVVFHAAARVSGSGSRKAFEADNVLATEALLAAAQAAGVRRFVHVSSAGIYGVDGNGSRITEATPLDAAIEKRGAYAWSKAEADKRVQEFARRTGFDAVIVRPGILYGAELKPFIARLHFPVPGKSGRRLVIGSRTTLLPLTHVDNACDAIVLAARRATPGAIYNVIDGAVQQGEYLDCLLENGAASLHPVFVNARWITPLALGCEIASRITRRTLPLSRYRLRRATESLDYDTTAVRRDLGWQPALDLDAGVKTLRREPTALATGTSSPQS